MFANISFSWYGNIVTCILDIWQAKVILIQRRIFTNVRSTEQQPEDRRYYVDPLSEDSSLDEVDIDLLEDADFEKDVFRTKLTLHISDLARKSHQVLSKKSSLYHWNLWTVATFYGLPVIQLVLTYQKLTNSTGNQDLCYYNFLCAHPLGKLSDFNHVFSNIGYVMLGILFWVCTWRKELLVKRTDQQTNVLHQQNILVHGNNLHSTPHQRLGTIQ